PPATVPPEPPRSVGSVAARPPRPRPTSIRPPPRPPTPKVPRRSRLPRFPVRVRLERRAIVLRRWPARPARPTAATALPAAAPAAPRRSPPAAATVHRPMRRSADQSPVAPGRRRGRPHPLPARGRAIRPGQTPDPARAPPPTAVLVPAVLVPAVPVPPRLEA